MSKTEQTSNKHETGNSSLGGVIERFTIEDAKEMVAAWESLPEGEYDHEDVTEWLWEDMKPVIDKFRAKIKNAL